MRSISFAGIAAIISLISTPVSSQTSDGTYTYVDQWHWNVQPNDSKFWDATDPEASCQSIDEAGNDQFHYHGDNYQSIENTGQHTRKCIDGDGHTTRVHFSCYRIKSDGSYDTTWRKLGGCNEEIPAFCQRVGNPINVNSMVKEEKAVDWSFPVEPRFQISRRYRSDGRIFERHNSRNPYPFGGVWFHNFSSFMSSELVPYGQSHAWHEESGRTYYFDHFPSGQPKVEGHKYTLIDPGPGGEIHDGTGFVRAYNGLSSLTSMRWPDGYEIQIDYAPRWPQTTRGQIEEVFDNRGHRAKYTWTRNLVPTSSYAYIEKIEVGKDDDAGNFVLAATITYDYEGIAGGVDQANLKRVSLLPSGESVPQVIAEYGYSSGQDFLPPALLTISTGLGEYASFDYLGLGDDFGAPSAKSPASFSYPLAESSSHFGGVEKFELTPNGVINPLGKLTEYIFASGPGGKYLSSVTGHPTPSCLGTSQSYDYTPNAGAAEGYVYEQIERNGSRTTFERDSRGLVVTKVEDADGLAPRSTMYTWHPDLRLPLTRTTTQMSETFVYDTDGLMTSHSQTDVLVGSPTNGEIRTWTYTYTTLSSGLKVLTSSDGPGQAPNVNDVTVYAYNADGTMNSMTDANGLTTIYDSYDELGNATRVILPDGVVWETTYDKEGQLIEVIENAGQSSTNITTFTYDIIGQLTSYTTASGETWTLTHDQARRLTSMENSTGERMNFTHDAASNVTSTEYVRVDGTTAFFQTTAYDELSRIKETLGAQGQQTIFSYDEEDNLTTVIDGAQFATTNSYDALNRLTQVIDRTSGLTEMDYDDADQMTEFTDPRQIDTGMTYNGFGELVQEVSADRGTMTYTYDSRGLVASMVDGNGVLSTYSYDDGGRITARKFPSDPSQNQNFTYDYTTNSQGEGKINRTDDASGFSNRRYDNGGYISRDLRRIENETYTTNYNVDSRGRLENVKTPGKLELSYFYDSQDRVTKITAQRVVEDPATNQFPPPVDVIKFVKYNPFGPVAQFRFGDNGLLNRRAFDQSYRLKAKRDWTGSAPLRNVTYGWTTRDNLSFVSDSLDSLKSETYQYTPREFLAEAVGEYGEIDYTYDAVGNRATRALYQNASTVTDFYAYPLTSNQLDSISLGAGGTRGFTYDAAGNVIYDNRNGQGYGYTYDAANRMESFSINGVVQEEYLYNAMGQQVVRRMTQAGKTIHVIHDLDGNRLAEYEIDNATGTRTLLQEYIWFDGVPVAIVDGQTDEIFFVRTDHIGRPVFAADANGVKVWEASYLPFGGVHVASTDAINLRFPGQWFHAEPGLHQNWMRDYDPTTGRYMQADPLGLVDGASVYGYALQNPGRYVDPTGEFSLPGFGLPGAVAGAAIGGAFGYIQTGCWQGALAGAAIGGVAGGLGTPLAAALGGNTIVAGGVTGFGSAAASQIAANEVTRFCGCEGVRQPLGQLVSTPDFYLNTVLGAYGGGLGGLINGTSSILGQWAAGSFRRQAISRTLTGGFFTGGRHHLSGGSEQ
ncbi:MAG: RHS repeat-associated core domain-containing protein [Paracoccaceae bacterium]